MSPFHAADTPVLPPREHLRAEVARRHARAITVLPTTGLAVALAVVAILWDSPAHSQVIWWFAAVAAAVATHGIVYTALRARAGHRMSATRWLWVHRACVMLQGGAWGTSALLLEVLPEGVLHQTVVFAVLVMVAGTMVAGAFDLVAAALFATPAGLPMLTHFVLYDGSGSAIVLMAVIAGLFLAAGAQSHRAFRVTALRRRSQALRQRENDERSYRLRQATALAGVTSWDYDPATRIVHFGEDIGEAMGYGRGGPEPLEYVLSRLELPSAQALEAAIEESCRSGASLSLEVELRTGADARRPGFVVMSAGAVLEGGRVVRLAGTMQDRTGIRRREREAADQSRLRQQLLHNTSQGIWYLDNAGLTTDLNEAMCRLLGRPRDQVLGRSVFDFFFDTDLAILHHQLELRKRGHKEGYEIGILRPDGTRVECFNNATPVYDAAGHKLGSVGMWTDLTAVKQATHRLREREAELRAVLEAMPGYILALDENLRVAFVNPMTAGMMGVTPEEAVGRTLEETLGRRAGAMAGGRWASLRTPGARETTEEHYAVDHGMRTMVLEVTRLAGPVEAGGRQRLYSFGVDITDRKAAEAALAQREAELRSALENFPGFVAMVDADQRYVYANERFARLRGKPLDQIIGRTLEEIQGPERTQELLSELPRLDAGEQITQELVYGPTHGMEDGSVIRIVRLAGPPLANGRRSYFSFGIDITASRRYEARITAALEAAEAASRAKSEFLSQVSHELRTPLNAVLGFAQLLETDCEHPLVPRQQLHVQEMLSGAQHLLDLINGLLDIGRIESGQFSVAARPVPLGPLLRDALALVRPVAERQRIRLGDAVRIPTGLQAMADATRITQIVVNLLGNAVKYNRPEGHVSVAAHATGDRVIVEVTDSGLGLSAEEQSRLFEPFQRLRAEGSGVEGTGIGLALSRRLAEAMDGRIGVDSQPGQGSTFWVDLPRAPDEALPPAADSAHSADSADSAHSTGQPAVPASQAATSGSTVLYIEDNPVNMMVMQAMLSRLPGVRMLSAEDGEPGLALALRERPDLILTDIQMPGMDGFELLRRLQAQEALRGIPVVAISADALPATVARGREAGFADYLTKPVQMKALHELLARLLPGPGPGDGRAAQGREAGRLPEAVSEGSPDTRPVDAR